MRKVTVLGSGSFGTALAKLLSDKGYPTFLWARREEQARVIEESRENATYLPQFRLGPTLVATHDLEHALDGTELIVSTIPSHGLRATFAEALPFLPSSAPIVSASKGIENESLELVSQILEDLVPTDRHGMLTFLSGPSFAREVAGGSPTAVSIAGRDQAVCERAQAAFTTERFRVYTTEDVVGVELGGALKNVIAIAAGCADGLGFGHNTRAAIITRGLAEITRLALHMGAHPLTLMGLSGMGDLVLTCTGDLSRNRSVGLELGRGKTLEEVLAGMTMVAEGVRTSKSAYQLAARQGVDMPIVSEVHDVIYGGKPAREAVGALMTRPLKHERS